jgi:4-hydroxy-4-methyl-2-oxoglutarate aldolase
VDRAVQPDEWQAAAGTIASATLFESNAKQGALPAAIKPLGPGWRICGPAVPVSTPPGDNYWIHRAVAQAAPGDVLVVATGGAYDNGYWGEILSAAALARGLGGVVIDGPARDGVAVVATGVPVFARGLNIIGPSKDPRCAGAVGQRIRIGGVQVDPGDLVVGDDDGVVVIAADRVAAAVAAAQERERSEADVMSRLRAGETTLQIFGLE